MSQNASISGKGLNHFNDIINTFLHEGASAADNFGKYFGKWVNSSFATQCFQLNSIMLDLVIYMDYGNLIFVETFSKLSAADVSDVGKGWL